MRICPPKKTREGDERRIVHISSTFSQLTQRHMLLLTDRKTCFQKTLILSLVSCIRRILIFHANIWDAVHASVVKPPSVLSLLMLGSATAIWTIIPFSNLVRYSGWSYVNQYMSQHNRKWDDNWGRLYLLGTKYPYLPTSLEEQLMSAKHRLLNRF